MNPVKVGLIGFGFSGSTFHAPIIQAINNFEIRKVVSSQSEKVKQQLPKAEVVSGIGEVLNDPEIELVVITTPNETHYPIARAALDAKKHVVVEKPFVIDLAEADDLIQLAEKQNCLLSVYHNRRWDNDFLTVQSCIRSGLLGDVHTYKAHFDRYRPEVRKRWREQDVPGSGILYDLGSHLIDQALQLFGPPATVFADLLAQRPKAETTDYFHLILGYEGNLRVILHGGCMVKEPGPRFEIHGTKGTFNKHGFDSQEQSLKQGRKPGDPGWGEDCPDQYGTVTTSSGGLEWKGNIRTLKGSYESYYQGIAASIRTGAPLPVTAREARETIRIIQAAIESHMQKRVISL
ncbi:oxidoreductase [Paenactinomyces guangxiensis]|uniref:Oxidoreductase n=1 Tax=Paenactinomyces guangxiensis TaxID=1490290 RepID=A0A7W2A7B1_9BACL|nr:oxidoreductase [Paenactinomyces guangxiensis]MBA4492962.1 oxidoreductase [Paenactinomyces guangxiensis]MBH8590189.1 oxidoreductase [Paenactinomyces guangxiensis]